MRFFNMAFILQSAALFLPALASYKISHTNEEEKKFMCYNRAIYARDYWEEKLYADRLVQTKQKTEISMKDITNISWPTNKSDLVLYDDNNSLHYYFHMLTSIADSVNIRGQTVLIRYSLLIDNYGRVCSIVMHEQGASESESRLLHDVIPELTHPFCVLFG
ncbi:unnamed protein product [Blumeria hordei]|uniref:Uncharacterized protein n=1 Tax=Blumeria hordei TaxID=2867405 RepID=A0A383UZ06_BLUHO|nr:unnamed protein product [Blumeria hordei]